jgi:hypothetical protein
MNEIEALYYGEVELIPGILCDGYVLTNNLAIIDKFIHFHSLGTSSSWV